MRSLRRATVLLAAALLVGVFAAYAPACVGGFIWDDDFHVTQNPVIVGPLGLAEIWTTPAAYYYPMVLTTFWLEHWIWGVNASAYHLVTLATHACAAVVLWRVLSRLRIPAPWFGAAVWALHPVQVESAAWVTELKNTQSALFFFMAIWSWLKWRESSASPRGYARGYYFLTVVFAIGAYTSKTSTVMLPVALLLMAWWLERDLTWKRLYTLTPLFAVSACAAMWTIWEQRSHSGASGLEWEQSGAERLILAGKSAWFYLLKAGWPVDLMFIYPRWEPHPHEVSDLLPSATLLVGGLGLWCFRQEARAVAFAASYFLALLFPVLGFFDIYFFRYSFVADHFQYLASVGPLVLLSAGLSRLCAHASGRLHGYIAPVGAVCLLGCLGSLTWQQSRVYRSSETLWRDALQKNSKCWLAYINLGKDAARAGHKDVAIDSYRRALALNPGYAALHNLLGNTLLEEHRNREAELAYRAALTADPKLPEAHSNLGMLLLGEGKIEPALAHFRRALVLNPNSPEAHNGLGNALLRQGFALPAIWQFRLALVESPELVAARFNLANALISISHLDEGITEYQRALRYDPAAVDIHTNLGSALYQKRNFEAAAQHFRRVLSTTDSVDARCNLAAALRGTGSAAEALQHYRRALQIDPNSIRACYGAAWLNATCSDPAVRDGAEALVLAQRLLHLTGEQDQRTHRVLAAAYAEVGRFSEAQAEIRRAVMLADGKRGNMTPDALEGEVRAYEAELPFREYR